MLMYMIPKQNSYLFFLFSSYLCSPLPLPHPTPFSLHITSTTTGNTAWYSSGQAFVPLLLVQTEGQHWWHAGSPGSAWHLPAAPGLHDPEHSSLFQPVQGASGAQEEGGCSVHVGKSDLDLPQFALNENGYLWTSLRCKTMINYLTVYTRLIHFDTGDFVWCVYVNYFCLVFSHTV